MIDNEKPNEQVKNTTRNWNHIERPRTYLRIATSTSLGNSRGKQQKKRIGPPHSSFDDQRRRPLDKWITKTAALSFYIFN